MLYLVLQTEKIFGQNFSVDKFKDLDNIRNLIESNRNLAINTLHTEKQVSLTAVLTLLGKLHPSLIIETMM